MIRLTPTARRRASIARRFEIIEALEFRNLATESLGILTAGIGVAAALSSARSNPTSGNNQAASYAPSVRVRATNFSAGRADGGGVGGSIAAPKSDWVMPASSI